MALNQTASDLISDHIRYDADFEIIRRLELSPHVLKQLLSHMTRTYLAEEDFDNADNLRIALKANPHQVAEYRRCQDEGCCGFHDEELCLADESGNPIVLLFGYNMGH